MISFIAAGFFSGALIGLRYKIIALFSASLVASLIILVCMALAGGNIGMISASSLVFAVSLQLGYVAGLSIRLALLLTRAARFTPAPRPVAG